LYEDEADEDSGPVTRYAPGSGFGAGFSSGLGFGAGRETPMLNST
jgi:hypothetical protein